MAERPRQQQKRRSVSKFVLDTLFASLPDLSLWDYLPGAGGRGASWFENPRLLERYHRRRRKRAKARRRMRRTRLARGQNPRTGAHRKKPRTGAPRK